MLQQRTSYTPSKIVGVDVHDAKANMPLAWMVKARTHQAAGIGIDGDHVTARAKVVVGLVEDVRDAWPATKYLGAAMACVPGIDRAID
jgi:hypothetical protein